MYDFSFQREMERRAKAERVARTILGLQGNAPAQQLKRAWRRACMKYHPDRRPGDPQAEERFVLLQRAYRCLAHGEGCEDLIPEVETPCACCAGRKYDGASRWAYFLSWREKFF